MNCGKEHIIKSLTSDIVLHLRWPEEKSAHPIHFTRDDLSELANSDKLFARKFDETIDPLILDYIDGMMLKPVKTLISA